MGKFNIYQVLPRLWGNSRFSDWQKAEFDYLKWLGMSHVWFTGVLRHARGKAFVKGDPGSPYAICDYYDVNPYLADDESRRMEEFEALIARTHEAGLKIIIDFVPNHVARDYFSAAAPDGVRSLGADDDCSVHWKAENDFYYYPGIRLQLPVEPNASQAPYIEEPAKASGNCFTPSPGKNDWYETVRLNYCPFHTPTWDKMYEIVRFWAQKGVDGFRCDMVELVPAPFFQWMIAKIKEEFPSVIFVAEVYERAGYSHYINEIGFDYLYHKTGFYDTVRAITEYNIHPEGQRPWNASAQCLSQDWQQVDAIQNQLLCFLENHDEQRVASDFYAGKAPRGLAALGFSLYFNRAPFMLYFGQEVGERGMEQEGFSGLDGRTTIFDSWTIDSISRLNKVIAQRAWENGGINELTEAGLSVREAELLCRYSQALQMAVEDKALREGSSFDLNWVQQDNKDELFSFLRHKDDHTVLVVCNFSAKKRQTRVLIPQEAKDYVGNQSLPDSVKVCIKGFDFAVVIL